VVALSGGSGVALDGGLRRGAARARLVVGGVAHPRRGQLGEDRVQGGAGLGSQVAIDRTHPVEALFAYGQTATMGAVVVGEVPVGVQTIGELVGQLAQLVGAVLRAQPSKLLLGLRARFHVDEVGQPMDEAADHRDMGRPEVSRPLCGCGCGQRRLERFAGQGHPLAEIFGLMNTPRRLGTSDPKPIR
jgi:hypothetical protein